MDKSMIKGVVIGGVAMTALAAAGTTGYQMMSRPKFAEVVATKAITEKVKTPREECSEVPVARKAPVQDQNRIAGTAIGAVAGGLLGNQVGGGSGKTIATVAGVAAGGYAGNQIQKSMQDGDVTTRVERRCKTVYDTELKHLGYDVTYRLNGKEETVRMSHDPGTQIPLKDGKPVLEAPEAKN